MIKGFKEFVFRGNVVELAVAFVMGAAFAAVVNSVVTSIVTPIVNAAGGGKSEGLGFSLRHTAGVPHMSAGDVLGKTTFINFSAIINALIVFLATALVVYFVFVVPMNKLAERRARRRAAGEEPEEAKTDDIVVLEEIRDLLRAQHGSGGGSHSL